MTPEVSVIIPCFNEPTEVFRRSLDSVIQQTLADIEIILILDNPDNSELRDIIMEYQTQHNNILFLEPEENLGRGKARNLGLSFAEGKYIAIHDADDIDEPNRLMEQVEYMNQFPNTEVLFSDIMHVDSENKEVQVQGTLFGKDIKHPSFFGRSVNHVTMFVKKEVMKTYTDDNFGEDFDMWVRFYKEGKVMGHTGRTHTRYLTPRFSSHADFVTKMKHWQVASIKILFRHIDCFYKDPLFYMAIGVMFSNYATLSLGKRAYDIHRTFLGKIASMITSIDRKSKK